MITVNIEKAKSIAHDKRREARAEEFKQLDIQATIPAMAAQAEQKRQEVRDKYAVMQTEIDAASTADEIKVVITPLLDA
ncbi:hypothetical protein [Acinetobacter baumannii]|uniref:hypothetical protein n=1 Tax=Acinetobacter baumannii TaxID=470 RepID=UPI003892A4E6